MGIVALVTWMATAGGGLYLLAVWLIEYDREFQTAARTRLPVPVISSHALLAVTGLVIWSAYLFTDGKPLAWAALAILGVVATLGLTMAVRWLRVFREPAPQARRPPGGPQPGGRRRRRHRARSRPGPGPAGHRCRPRSCRPSGTSRCRWSSCTACWPSPPWRWSRITTLRGG